MEFIFLIHNQVDIIKRIGAILMACQLEFLVGREVFKRFGNLFIELFFEYLNCRLVTSDFGSDDAVLYLFDLLFKL